VEGAESVQAYIHDPKSRLPRPEKELKAFDKVFLGPGEIGVARLEVDRYSVGYYDTDINAWIAEEGRFEVWIGASSRDIRYAFLLPYGFFQKMGRFKKITNEIIDNGFLSRSRSLLLGFSRWRFYCVGG
jgi:hypothetical protein